MGLFDWFRRKRPVQGAYADAARYRQRDRGRSEWSGLTMPQDANVEIDPAARKRLLELARYEYLNSPIAHGLVNLIADYVVDQGPRLQLGDFPAAQQLEQRWAEWAERERLVEQLRLAVLCLVRDGESFLVQVQRGVGEFDVQLGVRVVEADFIADPQPIITDPLHFDGIHYQPDGTPEWYSLLDAHPSTGPVSATRLAARSVWHFMKRWRPSQLRGVSWLTPVLQRLAAVRRYLEAVLTTAELAAEVGGVLYSEHGAIQPVEPLDEFKLPRGSLVTLPSGWKVAQLRPEQPTSMHEMFLRSQLREIGKALGVPYNLVSGDSSAYNMASGRLDLQTWHLQLTRIRRELEQALNWLALAWLDEALLVFRFSEPVGVGDFKPAWAWPGFPVADPLKEAEAAAKRLETGLSTYAEEIAALGKDWREVMEQRATEQEVMRSLGLVADTSDNDEGEADIS